MLCCPLLHHIEHTTVMVRKYSAPLNLYDISVINWLTWTRSLHYTASFVLKHLSIQQSEWVCHSTSPWVCSAQCRHCHSAHSLNTRHLKLDFHAKPSQDIHQFPSQEEQRWARRCSPSEYLGFVGFKKTQQEAFKTTSINYDIWGVLIRTEWESNMEVKKGR